MAVRFDHIANCVAVLDNGIGRFVVHPIGGDLLIYEEENKKNTRLICYNCNNAHNQNMIKPYSKYLEQIVLAGLGRQLL